MATPVVIVASGGLPVVESDRGFPATIADNGFGIPITYANSGTPISTEGGGGLLSIAPGPTFWADPSVASLVTLNGGDIASLLDQSGQARAASQGTAAQQPLYATAGSGINSKGVANFTGANNDALTLASSLDLARNKPGLSFAFIGRLAAIGTNARFLTILNNGGGAAFSVTLTTAGLLNLGTRRVTADAFSSLSSIAAVSAGVASFLCATVDYATGAVVTVIDGTSRTQTAAWATGAASEDLAATGAPTLGRQATNVLTGDLGECCFWPRVLSATEIANLRNIYFKPKWGTP